MARTVQLLRLFATFITLFISTICFAQNKTSLQNVIVFHWVLAGVTYDGILLQLDEHSGCLDVFFTQPISGERIRASQISSIDTEYTRGKLMQRMEINSTVILTTPNTPNYSADNMILYGNGQGYTKIRDSLLPIDWAFVKREAWGEIIRKFGLSTSRYNL